MGKSTTPRGLREVQAPPNDGDVWTYVEATDLWTPKALASEAVTSAALTMPADFSVAGSPITTTGTFAVTRVTQLANRVMAGPTSGGAATPAYRALVAADIPTVALATALATPRAINGVNFDGTAPITVTAAASTLSGTTLASGVVTSSLTAVGILASPHLTTPTIDSGGLTITAGDLTFGEGGNVVAGTSTGTKIGTATTQKLGFYNATPITRRSGAAQALVVTTGATLAGYGYVTAAQADAIVTLVNELRNWAVAQGFIAGA